MSPHPEAGPSPRLALVPVCVDGLSFLLAVETLVRSLTKGVCACWRLLTKVCFVGCCCSPLDTVDIGWFLPPAVSAAWCLELPGRGAAVEAGGRPSLPSITGTAWTLTWWLGCGAIEARCGRWVCPQIAANISGNAAGLSFLSSCRYL